MWQTYWLHENWNRQDNALDQIACSLSKMEDGYEDFIQQLKQTGWDTNEIKLKLGMEFSTQYLSKGGPLWLARSAGGRELTIEVPLLA
ncbi:hypothetical protein TIFTF001_050433 [Ficus carica]|uniref:Uncharacterized protein n=1 Tax=Ficus carica TaxID=3494 RepID=A0AA88CM07_FICCA|nr:hypothetical protein TIFTF001_050433 [Ficus carica]